MLNKTDNLHALRIAFAKDDVTDVTDPHYVLSLATAWIAQCEGARCTIRGTGPEGGIMFDGDDIGPIDDADVAPLLLKHAPAVLDAAPGAVRLVETDFGLLVDTIDPEPVREHWLDVLRAAWHTVTPDARAAVIDRTLTRVQAALTDTVERMDAAALLTTGVEFVEPWDAVGDERAAGEDRIRGILRPLRAAMGEIEYLATVHARVRALVDAVNCDAAMH